MTWTWVCCPSEFNLNWGNVFLTGGYWYPFGNKVISVQDLSLSLQTSPRAVWHKTEDIQAGWAKEEMDSRLPFVPGTLCLVRVEVTTLTFCHTAWLRAEKRSWVHLHTVHWSIFFINSTRFSKHADGSFLVSESHFDHMILSLIYHFNY